MAETFDSLLVRLSRAGVDYLVAGGIAVCLNGYVQTTPREPICDACWTASRSLGRDSLANCQRTIFPLEEGAVRIVEDFTIDIFTLLRSHTYFARVDAANS